jgi:AraC family transcriptional regulator of adaptative response/methylated-DNA-[protein]-cysteine methyltransferase
VGALIVSKSHNSIRIGYVLRPCSLGLVLVAGTERGVCLVLLGDDAEPMLASLRRRYPKAELKEDEGQVAAWGERICRGWDSPVRLDDVPLDIRGTPFQRQVWEALRAIPAGSTSTYSEIARRVGRPKAVRAVGNACGANPAAPVIPCHRVLASDGTIGGYGFGLERKKALLARERSLPR